MNIYNLFVAVLILCIIITIIILIHEFNELLYEIKKWIIKRKNKKDRKEIMKSHIEGLRVIAQCNRLGKQYDYEINKIAQKLFWAVNTRLDENFQYIANTKLGKRKITLRSFGSQNNLIYHNEFNNVEFVLESYSGSTCPLSSIHCKTDITKEQANLALYELEELLK